MQVWFAVQVRPVPQFVFVRHATHVMAAVLQ
jgi:hypothetical protein